MKLTTLMGEINKRNRPKIVKRYRMPFVSNSPMSAAIDASMGNTAVTMEESKNKYRYMVETDDASIDSKKFGHIKTFMDFTLKNLGIKTPVKVTMTKDRKAYGLKTLAHFDPQSSHCVVYIGGRNVADILRSIAHELVHKKQMDNDEIKGPVQDIGGKIEDEANAVAGQLVKKFGYENPQIFQ